LILSPYPPKSFWLVCGVRGGVVCGGGFMRYSGALGGSVVSFSIRVIKVLILGYFGWFEEVIVWCVYGGVFGLVGVNFSSVCGDGNVGEDAVRGNKNRGCSSHD